MDAMDFTDLFGDASMDQLLHDLLDSDQNTSSWLHPTDGLSGPASPASLPPVHPVVPWRCLDASHGAHCSRCVPAPTLEDMKRWELTGDPGKRNGEKKLRSMLTRTGEWGSSATRMSAAAALEARFPRLGAALTHRHAADMNKETLLVLCHYWGFRSDLWRLRGNRPTPPLKTASVSPSAVPSTPVPGPTTPPGDDSPPVDLVWQYIGTQARPRSNYAGRMIAGPAARALAQTDAQAAAQFCQELPTVKGIIACMEMRQHVELIMSMSHSLQEVYNLLDDMVGAEPSSGHAAYPEVVNAVPELLATGRSHYQQLLARTQARLEVGGVTPSEQVWLNEFKEAASTAAGVQTDLSQLLTRSRAHDDVAGHIRTCGHVVDSILYLTLSIRSGMKQRAAWLQPLATEHSGVNSPAGSPTGRPPLMMAPTPGTCPNVAAAVTAEVVASLDVTVPGDGYATAIPCGGPEASGC